MPRRFLVSSLLLSLALACTDDEPVEPVLPQPQSPPPSVVLVSPDNAVVAIGDSVQMYVNEAAYAGGGSIQIGWAVSDSTVASVSASGMVVGRKSGSTGVRATLTVGTSTGQGVASLHVR